MHENRWNDKPDIRVGIEFGELTNCTTQGITGFNAAELVVGIAVREQE